MDGRFDRHGDALFHLFRCQTIGGGLHIHLGRGELGEHIQGHPAEDRQAPEGDQHGGHNHQPAPGDGGAQRLVEQAFQHGNGLGGGRAR